MNVLIIGEFSGFAYNLKKGFESLGHHVIVVQNGDGYKKIPSSGDDVYYEHKYLYFGKKKILQSASLFNWLATKKIKKTILQKKIHFDIIVIICDSFVSTSWKTAGFPYSLLKKYRNEGSKIILTTCGGDAAYKKYVRDHYYFKQGFPQGVKVPSKDSISKLKEIIRLVSCIVPTAYDYDYTIRKFIKEEEINPPKIKYIQLPIKEEDITISKNDKTLIFHGLNRPIRKGTPYIKEALLRIKEKYADIVDVVIDGKMPFERYCKLMNDVDILVDQTNSHGFGINAGMGLMKGKVVLSGNTKEESNLRGYDCPIINIEPDSNMIYNIIENLILDNNKIKELKEKSRNYALTYLRADIVAKQYIESVGIG